MPSEEKDFSATPVAAIWSALEEFRKIDPKFPIQWASAFSYVGIRGEVSLRELEAALGVPQSTISAVVLGLSTGVRPGAKGLDLITTAVDPLDRRARLLRLSPKGKRVWSTIESYFNG